MTNKRWTKDRWEYLLDKYLSGTCSREEMDELLTQAGLDPDNRDLAEVLHKHWERSDEKAPVIDWDARLQAIMRQKPGNDPEKEASPFISRWRWHMAVAAVLVLFMSGMWLKSLVSTRNQRRRDIVATPTAPVRHDALPGGNKAILTLANGDIVTLDSAHNGSLAMQANTNVLKKASGVLAYVKNGNTSSGSQPLYNKVSTPNGGQYQVVLPDGSKVWLNASSSLRFPTDFTGSERNVEISGEAYFEIAKDPVRPFKVAIFSSAGLSTGQQVEVLGTSFNVMAYSDENVIRTTLLDGSVKMKNGMAENVLEPGQQAQSALNKPGLRVISDADVAAAVAWKDGYFNFNKQDIQTVMRQLARWYDVEVSYVGPPNDRLFWGGMQRDLPLSAVFKILEKSGVQFSIEGKKVIVTM